MKFVRNILTIIGLSIILTGCTLPFFKPKKAALQVTSAPRATVFLDSKHVGQTPFFDENLKPGDYALKLVPEATSNSLLSWETKITLTPQILTVVNRDIGPTDSDSSGEILTLEPLSSKTNTNLSVVSIPDSAVVKVDSSPKGFTPVSLDDVSPGEHTIIISAPGFKEKTIKAKVTTGHKLTLSVQLAKEPILQSSPDESSADEDEDKPEKTTTKASPKPSPSPEISTQIASASATTTKKPYVEILDNPLGFLRIRQDASTSSPEIARAVPGQKLPYLNQENNGWYKVTYSTGKSGWLARGASGEYAKLVE